MKGMSIKDILQYSDQPYDEIMDNIARWGDLSSELQYPTEEVDINDNFPVDILYPAFISPAVSSELTAIIQYTQDESQFDNVSNLMLGISIIEMRHYDKLGDVIRSLGGNLNQPWNNSNVKSFGTRTEMLESAIRDERETIAGYEDILEAIKKLPQTKTSAIVFQIIEKHISDENVHIEALTAGIEFVKERGL